MLDMTSNGGATMRLCAYCAKGQHPHDRYPDGADASCPNLAVDHEHPDDACMCPVRLPVAIVPHRCSCGNIHQYGTP